MNFLRVKTYPKKECPDTLEVTTVESLPHFNFSHVIAGLYTKANSKNGRPGYIHEGSADKSKAFLHYENYNSYETWMIDEDGSDDGYGTVVQVADDQVYVTKKLSLFFLN